MSEKADIDWKELCGKLLFAIYMEEGTIHSYAWREWNISPEEKEAAMVSLKSVKHPDYDTENWDWELA
jgi:hypothetical protein